MWNINHASMNAGLSFAQIISPLLEEKVRREKEAKKRDMIVNNVPKSITHCLKALAGSYTSFGPCLEVTLAGRRPSLPLSHVFSTLRCTL